MSELPGYSPYGVPPPPSSSTTSLAAPTTSVPTTPTSSHTVPILPSLPPPFPEPRNCLAGPVQTISISDMQHDYFLITQATATTYSISLTTDPTPLYRVEVDTHPAADPAVQVFDLFNPLPLAAARLHPAVTTATTCTNGPAGDNPKWRPINQQNHTMLPLVAIPGIPPIERCVRWQHTNKQTKHLELYLREPLFGKWYSESDTSRDQLLARFGIHGMAFNSDRVIEIRRGGGLEFELGVLVQAFAVSEAERRKKLKKGK